MLRGIFERYLTLWVGLCVLAGVALGKLFPAGFQLIATLEYAHVNLVVAFLIWIMIFHSLCSMYPSRFKVF